MKALAIAALTVAGQIVSACSYRSETLPLCFTNDIGPGLSAVKRVTMSGVYRGGDVELQHTFCSTHDDRLAIAEKLLAAGGFSFGRHIAEVGKCTDVNVKSPFTTQAIQKQVTTFCGIAAAAGVAYSNWSGEIGDRFVFVSGKYISFTRRGELPKA